MSNLLRGAKPRPIHRRQFGVVSRLNVPESGPITPRLRLNCNVDAIGFLNHYQEQEKDFEGVSGDKDGR